MHPLTKFGIPTSNNVLENMLWTQLIILEHCRTEVRSQGQSDPKILYAILHSPNNKTHSLFKHTGDTMHFNAVVIIMLVYTYDTNI